MKVLFCENNSSGTSSLFMVTDCLRKLLTRINIADSVTEKISQQEQSQSPDKATGCLENFFEQMTGKQNSVKTCTKFPKKRNTAYIWKSL